MKRSPSVVLVLAMLVWASPAQATYGEASLRCTISDPLIYESSGLATSPTQDVLFTHNDSGDVARFFALGPDCTTRGMYLLATGAVDWEDMSAGPGSAGGRSLYFADIGDNNRARPFMFVHEVEEPDVSIPATSFVLVDPTPTVVLYEDGPRDAETFLVTPDGRFVIVEKTVTGVSGVYMDDGPAPVRILRRVAEINLDPIASPYDPARDYAPTSRVQTTGGDITADGSRIVVRTYVEAFEWIVPPGAAIADVLHRAPDERITLAPTAQGEAIAYSPDAGAVLTTSEGANAPVHEVPRG